MNTQKTTKRTTNKKKTNSKSKTANKNLYLYNEGPLEELKDKRLEHIVEDLLENTQNGNYKSMMRFRAEHRIPYITWKAWRDRYKLIREADRMAKEFIAAQRIEAAMEKKCDSRLLSEFHFSFHSQEHKEHYQWTVELKDNLIRDLRAALENSSSDRDVYINLDGDRYKITEDKDE